MNRLKLSIPSNVIANNQPFMRNVILQAIRISSTYLHRYETDIAKKISWGIWNHLSWVLNRSRSQAKSSHGQGWLHDLLWEYPLLLGSLGTQVCIHLTFLTPSVLSFGFSFSPPLNQTVNNSQKQSKSERLAYKTSLDYIPLNNNSLASIHI